VLQGESSANARVDERNLEDSCGRFTKFRIFRSNRWSLKSGMILSDPKNNNKI